MNNVLKNRLRSSLCGIAVCSVFAVSAFAVPLASVKGVAAEQGAYRCEENRDANDYTCASSSANAECVGGDEDYETTEEHPYQAEVKHSTIASNFDLTEFVTSYNSVAEDDNRLNASSIEYTADVNVIGYSGAGLDSEDYATYFDFDGDNGYIVINGDKEILDFKTTGDYEYLRDEEELYFSMSDGFVYVDDNGMYCNFIEDSLSDGLNVATATDESDTEEIKYPGQDEAGDGDIKPYKINDYVNARYPGYVLTKSDHVANYNEFKRQWTTSYYLRDWKGVNANYSGTSSEGNCALNSMYNVLHSWRKQGLVDFNISTIDLSDSITSDVLYEWYITFPRSMNMPFSRTYRYIKDLKQEILVDNTWKVNTDCINAMPLLYDQIRSYALAHEYDPMNNGYKEMYYIDTFQHVANTLNNNNISVKNSAVNTVAQQEVLSDRAVLMTIHGSSTYHTHAVTLCGYYEYSKVMEIIPGYQTLSRIYFYRIADNWKNSARVFDPNTKAQPTMLYFMLANNF